jgi:hypothetical protein
MRIQIGDTTQPNLVPPHPHQWTRVTAPASFWTHILAWIIGVLALSALLALVIGSSIARFPQAGNSSASQPTPWLVVITTLVLAIPAHELTHALFNPGGALSPRTTFVAWPRRLRFGVYFEGSMSRRRWLLMRLAPFLLLAVLPAVILAGTNPSHRTSGMDAFFSLLLLTSSLGSGGDLLAACWVARHIPKGSTLGFFSGKAYWKPGAVTPA